MSVDRDRVVTREFHDPVDLVAVGTRVVLVWHTDSEPARRYLRLQPLPERPVLLFWERLICGRANELHDLSVLFRRQVSCPGGVYNVPHLPVLVREVGHDRDPRRTVRYARSEVQD